VAKKKAKKRGRPTKYCKDFVEQVFKLALLGHTEAKIADFYSINQSTLTRWKKRYKSFRASLNAGREPADAEVAASLYQRACGYSHPEDKIFCSDGEVTIVPTIKHYPPDTAAAFIWLKNRAGWKDKSEVEQIHHIVAEKVPFKDVVIRVEERKADGDGIPTD